MPAAKLLQHLRHKIQIYFCAVPDGSACRPFDDNNILTSADGANLPEMIRLKRPICATLNLAQVICLQ